MNINFTFKCPGCGKQLWGEEIEKISRPNPIRTFFYTESGHQLVFDGINLSGWGCLDLLAAGQIGPFDDPAQIH